MTSRRGSERRPVWESRRGAEECSGRTKASSELGGCEGDPHHIWWNCRWRGVKLGKEGICQKYAERRSLLFAQTSKSSKNGISYAFLLGRGCLGVAMPHDDALVVTLTVANHVIHRILVDNGRSADILYWPAFQQMGIDQDTIKPFGSPLVGSAENRSIQWE